MCCKILGIIKFFGVQQEEEMFDFAATTTVVTGGAQGIGRAVVDYLLQCRGNVAALDIDSEAGEELLADHEGNERLLFLPADVGNEDEVAASVARIVECFGTVDSLVNNAGIAAPSSDPVEHLALEDWDAMLRVNLTGAFLMVKHAASHLGRQRGAIVNMASTRALQSEANTEAYAASKGGLVALTHALAVSFSGRIRVNAVLPGWIDVSSLKKEAKRFDPQLSDEDHRQHPAGRVGLPGDIAALTAFLLSREAGFITGQSFVADGGMTRKMIYVE